MAHQHSDNRLTPTERRASGALATVFGLRMLGLFLIMPVIAIYGQQYPDYTPLLIGLAIGAYGLTQALLQIPMGMLSDRIGRRPVIVGGLLLFALGSVVAAMADTLTGVVIGRALQGTGAIAAAILALAADITRDSQRPKVMATIGMFIGLSFALALVLGPLLGEYIGLQGLFVFTAVSALFGIVVLLIAVPSVTQKTAKGDLIPVGSELGSLFKHPQLARLNFGVFVLHCVLTAFFVVVPLQFVAGGLATEQHAWLYLPTLLASFALMIPMLIIAERKRKQPVYFRVAIVLLLLAVAVIVWVPPHWTYLVVAVVLFFTGFNFLEASLPSSLTRFAPAGSKGSASGIYSTAQFLGAFIGGAAGGYVYQQWGLFGIGIFTAVLLVFWFASSFGMQPPPQQQNVSLPIRQLNAVQAQQLAEQLAQATGVEEVRIVSAEQTVYLKVHKTHYNEAELAALLTPYQN
ncbi:MULTISPECIES: MFS transporter [Pseudidiomarina]|uniref:MFS family arabinose efflux permease n=4 Tax=Pseudidiomarina TaxID=2800384 RepID=A0A368UJD2_9GAMM|nr:MULTISPECIES: MFS transporter [Pseudidiomarina]MDT7525862.1 MFS transporter [Pseudidiomarina sp. GXY010]MDX1526577.1 MFS transporter [Pseudidiomarina maritima]PWW06099.1 putative MFS family arabinose efflux permease [Pseudidiomarina maritima]RBP86391.1 putative MFS family arabinose efflux permease [Pseudidiomarina tainanensis]RCW27974.1 putative MFS family arabinose efflux permease [Pseudidiomarina tainanensis]